MVLPVRPGHSACLRCLYPEPPEPGSLPTCQTMGVLNTAPALVAALQVTAALQFLLEGRSDGQDRLHVFDLWTWQIRQVPLSRAPDCPTCGKHRFEFLEGRFHTRAEPLCGRDSVQVFPAKPLSLDMDALAHRLQATMPVKRLGALAQVEVEGHDVVIFEDGRMLVRGTRDTKLARALHARLVGS